MLTAMPASSGDSLLHIQESLKNSLSKGTPSLDQRLVSSSKKILMHKIEFRPAEKASHVFQFESLRSKYIPLNAGAKKGSSPEVVEGYKSPEGAKMTGESLPSPKVVLFPPDKVQLDWCSVKRIGAGLVNLGNTCFLNSTLQCLTYCAPLFNYLVMENHSNQCTQAGFCMLCEVHQHIRRCFEQSGSCIKPHSIVHKLRVIAKHMHLGRQEDAHEFLRYVVDHMQKACLFKHPKLDNFSKDTSAVYQIFGGYLRSQVLCLRCKGRSNTYDPFLDISLDIKNSPSVQKALERYVQPERLDSDNAYNCTKCKQKVPAQKRFTIHKAPNVLTLQLKRFDCSRPSAKVTRHVHFPERLDLSPYTSSKGEQSQVYQLYAVLVHSGYSCNSGHYYCFVKAPNRVWYCMNDQHVSETSVNRVLSAEAYLLFYQRGKSQAMQIKSPQAMKSSTSLSSMKPTISSEGQNKADAGMPVSRKSVQKPNGPLIGPQKPPHLMQNSSAKAASPSTSKTSGFNSPTPSVIPAATQRSKISFGIKPKDNAKEETDNKPRLVMHIKHGKVCYNSVDEKKNKAATEASTRQKLVPYNGESDSSEDTKDASHNKPGSTSSSSKTNGHDHKKVNGSRSSPGKVNGTGTSPNKSNTTEEQKNGLRKETSNTSHKLVNGHHSKFEPVIDDKLKATRTVPGGYGPLDRETSWLYSKKDRPTSISKDDTHGVFPRIHKTKVLRRSFSDDVLTVDVQAQKINATTRWNIQEPEALVSPSLASGSSTCSVNSTTEWSVRHNEKHRNPEHAQPTGWTVTPTKARTPPAKEMNNNENSHKSNNTDAEPTQKQNTAHQTSQKVQEKSMDDVFTHSATRETVNDTTSSTSNLIQGKGSNESHSDIGHMKKHKKTGAFPFKLSCVSSGSDSPVDRKPLLKAKSYDMSVYDFSDGEEHSNPKGSQHETKLSEDAPTETHKHKKKKHKKHRDEEHVDDHGASSHKKKKKKKKHKKRKYEEREEEAREEASPAKKVKNDAATEYTWVEKSVPVQHWDQHIAESKGCPDMKKDISKLGSKSWDGTRKNDIDVLSELQRPSEWGKGTKVMSWDGERSQLDQESSEHRKDHKRRWSDEYEEDLDRGKVKKVKNVDHGSGGSHGNLFQKYQESRHQNKEWLKSPGSSMEREYRRHDGHSSSFRHKHDHHDRKHTPHYSKHHREHYHTGGHRGRHDR